MSSSVVENQEKIFQYQRQNYFKGTIAVASIYGTVALLMFLVAVLSESGKSILTERLLPFTVTFIGGMIVVTVLMVVSIFAVQPPPVIEMQYDNMKCPDFWRLEQTPEDILDNYSPSQQYMMKYMCVNDKIKGSINDISGTDYIKEVKGIGGADIDTQNLMEAGKYMYGMYNTTYTPPNGPTGVGTGTTFCGAVFPDFFNYIDVNNDKSQPNKLRCKYAKLCNTPWSSVCPNQ